MGSSSPGTETKVFVRTVHHTIITSGDPVSYALHAVGGSSRAMGSKEDDGDDVAAGEIASATARFFLDVVRSPDGLSHGARVPFFYKDRDLVMFRLHGLRT